MALNHALFSSKTTEWETPHELFDRLNARYHFTLDPCATKENAKCRNYFTKEDDGLSKSWFCRRVFCNPPYSRDIGKWIEKATREYATDPDMIIVMLLPARTDTKWFHKYIYRKAHVEFLPGRLKFGGSKNSAPFPSMLVFWGLY